MMRRRKELLRGHGEDLASGGIGWRFQQEPEISKFSRFLFYLLGKCPCVATGDDFCTNV
jgi:hypothetical protein